MPDGFMELPAGVTRESIERAFAEARRTANPPTRPPARETNVLGWDTEVMCGFVMLLANGRGEMCEQSETDVLLDFLFERGKTADYNVWWNVGFDFACILKPLLMRRSTEFKEGNRKKLKLGKEARLISASIAVHGGASADELREKRRIKDDLGELETVETFETDKYRIRYIPKKGFRMSPKVREKQSHKKGRSRPDSVYFFDAMPWWATGLGESASLGKTAEKYLGQHKTAEEEGIAREDIGTYVGYYDAHREAIGRYCVQDCNLTAQLFKLTLQAFENIGMPFPQHPWSRASVSREYIKQAGTLEKTAEAYKKLAQTPHNSFWERAYAGACIYARGIGTWSDVVRFDICSAYPNEMRKFPSLEGAYVVERDNPQFAACYFKFYQIRFTPTPRRALRAKKPAGDFEEDDSANLQYHSGGAARLACVTQLDLDTFDAWGDTYEILDAVGIVTPSSERPFAFQEQLYESKTRIKKEFPEIEGHDSPEYLNAKIPMNGCYGIVAQSRPTTTQYTNFIYAAYITAGTRKMLWLKALECERAGGTVLSFMTDGLFVSGLTRTPPSSKILGEWETEEVGDVTIFANGIYVCKGKLKKRGAPHLTSGELRACERPYVSNTHSGPCSIKQAVVRNVRYLPKAFREEWKGGGDILGPAWIGIFVPETKTFQPAQMLNHAGLRVPTELFNAPLKSFFTESWFLEPRSADEAPAVAVSWADELGLTPEPEAKL